MLLAWMLKGRSHPLKTTPKGFDYSQYGYGIWIMLDKDEGGRNTILSMVFRKDLWALIWLTFLLVYLGDRNVS